MRVRSASPQPVRPRAERGQPRERGRTRRALPFRMRRQSAARLRELRSGPSISLRRSLPRLSVPWRPTRPVADFSSPPTPAPASEQESRPPPPSMNGRPRPRPRPRLMALRIGKHAGPQSHRPPARTSAPPWEQRWQQESPDLCSPPRLKSPPPQTGRAPSGLARSSGAWRERVSSQPWSESSASRQRLQVFSPAVPPPCPSLTDSRFWPIRAKLEAAWTSSPSRPKLKPSVQISLQKLRATPGPSHRDGHEPFRPRPQILPAQPDRISERLDSRSSPATSPGMPAAPDFPRTIGGLNRKSWRLGSDRPGVNPGKSQWRQPTVSTRLLGKPATSWQASPALAPTFPERCPRKPPLAWKLDWVPWRPIRHRPPRTSASMPRPPAWQQRSARRTPAAPASVPGLCHWSPPKALLPICRHCPGPRGKAMASVGRPQPSSPEAGLIEVAPDGLQARA